MPMGVYPRKSIEERFWSKVNKNGPIHPVLKTRCWIWVAYKDADGYGTLWTQGMNRPAHRISWTIHFGDIPEGLCVCHYCDNSECTNPKHLWLGTSQENTKDRDLKGRQAKGDRHYYRMYPEEIVPHKGEDNGMAKLTEIEVKEVRRLHRTGKISISKLSLMFNVSYMTIYRIVKRILWKHI